MLDDDASLLESYSRERSVSAFKSLVERHSALVFSTARRQVRSPELAEEVAQAVFLQLARCGPELRRDTSLQGWLYLVTKRKAIDVRRSEVRRVEREREAAELARVSCSSDSDWSEVEPLLDDAIDELQPLDREAVLLRYFQNLPFRDVGRNLQISEDAAQKRVSRALERLREVLESKGVNIGSASLSALITAQGVQILPPNLGASLVGPALSGLQPLHQAHTVAMSTTGLVKTTVIAAAIALLVGISVQQAWRRIESQAALTKHEERNAALERRLANAETDREFANRERGRLERENTILRRRLVELGRARIGVGDAPQGSANPASSTAQPTLEPLSPVRTFSSSVHTSVRWGEAVAMGGWRTENDKHVVVFVTPAPGVEDATVELETRFLELPPALMDGLGLSHLQTEAERSSESQQLSASDYQRIVSLARTNLGVHILNAPKVSTLSGRRAAVAATQDRQIRGSTHTVGPSLDLTPTISADGASVDLDLTALLRLLDQSSAGAE